MEQRFFIRPEIFTYLYLLLFLWILGKRPGLTPGRRMLVLAIIQLFWVNTQGLFVLGIFLTGAFFLEKLFEAVYKKKGVKEVREAACLLMVIIAVSLINPYGVSGLLFPLKLFTRIGPRENFFRMNIKEFISPLASSGYYLYKSYALLFIALVLISWRRLLLHQVLFSCAMLFLSLNANRNINLFILASLPVMMYSLDSWVFRKREKGCLTQTRTGGLLLTAFCGILMGAYLLSLYLVLSNTYYITFSSQKRFGTGISQAFYPASAVEFVLRHDIKGKMFNDIGTGSYAIYRFYPHRKVFIDGRLEVMGDAHFNNYIEVISRAVKLKEFLKKENFDIILFRFEPGGENLVRFFSQHKDYQLVFFDHSGFLFLKKGLRDDLSGRLLDHISYLERHIKERINRKPEPQRFFCGDPVPYYYYGKILMNLGYRNLAGLYLTEAIKINPDLPYIYKITGDVYLSLGRLDAAQHLYKEALRLFPADTNSMLGLVRIAFRKKELGRACDMNRKALRLKPDDATLLFYMAVILYQKQDYQDAFFCFEELTADRYSRKMRAIALLNMGACLKKQGQIDKAQSCFQKAFALDPSLKEKQEKGGHDPADLSFGIAQDKL